MNHRLRAPIIVIFGAPGVGKSTLAHHLSRRLHIVQGTTSDVIVAAYRAIFPRHPVLKQLVRHLIHSKRRVTVHELRRNMVERARLTAPAFNYITEYDTENGIPTILEGMHLIPRFLDRKHITAWATVAAPPDIIYQQWLNYPKSRRRPMPFPLSVAKKINAIHLAEARRHHVPIITELDLKKRVQQLTALVRKNERQNHHV